METLLRPAAWTKTCASKPAGGYLDFDGHDWDDEHSTVFASSDPDRQNFMASLRVLRSGAINQGVFTSGSLTSDGRSRVDAFVDSWHCRRLARRNGLILAAVLEHLAQSMRKRILTAFLYRWKAAPPLRRLLRPKLFLLLDVRRRSLLQETFTSWALLMRQRVVDRGFVRRRGVRLLFLLRRREARLKVVGVERWKEVVQATQQLERMKALSFERWRLFVLLRRSLAKITCGRSSHQRNHRRGSSTRHVGAVAPVSAVSSGAGRPNGMGCFGGDVGARPEKQASGSDALSKMPRRAARPSLARGLETSQTSTGL
eukprot:jgi/Undpi1/13248/HiC_scaffold_8.g02910.m1